MTTAVVLPGQGSQRAGMGADLFGRYPELEQEASGILGYSLRDLCLNNPGGRLRETAFTQPARYVVNVLALRAAIDDGLEPDVLLGHSVGEYSALYGAGVFGFATGLRLVTERARLMATVSGAMSAVVGLDSGAIEDVLSRAGLTGIDVACLNAADQIVIAGPLPLISAASGQLLEAGAFKVSPLEVSGPFHSRYMRSAAREFAAVLAGYRLAGPRLPVIANRTAREYPPRGLAPILAEQIDHTVLWAESLDNVLTQDPGTKFTELGSPPVLTGTVRRARQRMAARAGR
jgi:malonyl CoA-acyl carrier protein transacylase